MNLINICIATVICSYITLGILVVFIFNCEKRASRTDCLIREEIRESWSRGFNHGYTRGYQACQQDNREVLNEISEKDLNNKIKCIEKELNNLKKLKRRLKK